MSEADADITTAPQHGASEQHASRKLIPFSGARPRHHLDIAYLSLKRTGVAASLVLHSLLIVFALVNLHWAMPSTELEPLVVSVTLEDMPEEEARRSPEEVEPPEEAAPPEGMVVQAPAKDNAKLISANKSDEAVIHPHDMFFGGVLKQGNEIRWSLRALAAEAYTLDDYLGNYKIRGEDRIIRIIDGRKKYGKLLFLDEQTGELRQLTQFGDKIFTYGPTFEAEEPVVGSITFLPIKHHAESGDTEIPSRILWLPPDPPSKYGEKIRFDEREVQVAAGLRGFLTAPPGKGPYPAVVWAADAGCRSHFSYRVVARELALNGMAMLSLTAPECPDPPDDLRPVVTAEHIRQGLAFLRNLPGVDARQVGVWARNAGLGPALDTFDQPGGPTFLITIQEKVDEDALSTAQIHAPRDVRSLWFLVGDNTWSTAMTKRLSGRDVEVRAITPPRTYDTRSDPDADIDRLKLIGPVYAADVLKWQGIEHPADQGDS